MFRTPVLKVETDLDVLLRTPSATRMASDIGTIQGLLWSI